MAPASALKKAGIRPVGHRRYELADGTYVEYAFGLAEIEFMGEITAGRIIFGPENIEPILGVTQLESAGIAVDPVNHTLKRLPAISLKRTAANWRDGRASTPCPRYRQDPSGGRLRACCE